MEELHNGRQRAWDKNRRSSNLCWKGRHSFKISNLSFLRLSILSPFSWLWMRRIFHEVFLFFFPLAEIPNMNNKMHFPKVSQSLAWQQAKYCWVLGGEPAWHHRRCLNGGWGPHGGEGTAPCNPLALSRSNSCSFSAGGIRRWIQACCLQS